VFERDKLKLVFRFFLNGSFSICLFAIVSSPVAASSGSCVSGLNLTSVLFVSRAPIGRSHPHIIYNVYVRTRMECVLPDPILYPYLRCGVFPNRLRLLIILSDIMEERHTQHTLIFVVDRSMLIVGLFHT